MKVYIGGTMRGSAEDDSFVDQDYRIKIAEILKKCCDSVDIFDPLGGCGINESNVVNFEEGKEVFFREIKEVGNCDLLIAYLPEASMGTAIEMWMAHHHKIPIITISTMTENWAIKFLSNEIFSSLKEFEQAVENSYIETHLRV